jgi:hypothetical protein
MARCRSGELLEKLVRSLRAEGTDVAFADVHLPVIEQGRRSGHIATIGEDHLFPTIEAAVAWFESAETAPGGEDRSST